MPQHRFTNPRFSALKSAQLQARALLSMHGVKLGITRLLPPLALVATGCGSRTPLPGEAVLAYSIGTLASDQATRVVTHPDESGRAWCGWSADESSGDCVPCASHAFRSFRGALVSS